MVAAHASAAACNTLQNATIMPVQYHESKCVKCRREGVKLFLKGEKCFTTKCPVARRPFAPGQHGPTARRPKVSVYGSQLREKQKAKRIYGLTEAQFMGYVERANRKVGDTGVMLQQMLETRLDNVVYRLGFAASRFDARQKVSHCHMTVNGKSVNIPSYRVAVGDVIALDATKFAAIKERVSKHQAPSWLALDASAMSGKMVAVPGKTDFDTVFDTKMIIEFYSR